MNKKSGIEGFIFTKHKNLLNYTTIYYDKKNNDINGDTYSFFRKNPDNLFKWWLEHILDDQEITLYRVRFFNYNGSEMFTPLEKIYHFEYNEYFTKYTFFYTQEVCVVKEGNKGEIKKYIIEFDKKKSTFQDVNYFYNKTHLLNNNLIIMEDSLGDVEVIVKNEIGEVRTDKKGSKIIVKKYKLL